MLLNEIKPSPLLAEYVRLYRIIDFSFGNIITIPPKLYTPRPEQCLQFYPRDTESAFYPHSNLTVTNKKAVITGQHHTLSHRYVGRDFLSFQVVFQPGALHRLTGIPMQELLNIYTDAEEILGTGLREINEQLAAASSYTHMILAVECFVNGLIRKCKKDKHAVDSSSALMLQEEECFNLDRFIRESHLCHRQFDRKFRERAGIAPKQFLQITRFDKAFRMKNRHPELDWLSVAVRCGYHDYQHLSKDYKEFTGYTPAQFFAIDNNAPERLFGDAEV